MTRFKFIPWLAIPALLLLGPVMPTATAATSEASLEDGLIYLPLEGQALEAANATRLTTSLTPGEVTIAQYGAADALVANRGRFLTVRFDMPYDAPYTLASLSFPSWVQIPNPALPFASFRSVRVLGADAAGNPDPGQTLFRYNRYWGSNSGAINTIPLGINVTDPGKVFFAVFDFPTPVSGVADTFPFMSTDRSFTDAGLFATSAASDTSHGPGIPPGVGTIVGTTLLADQNLQVAMTVVLSGAAPLNAPSGLGLNLKPANDLNPAQAEFTYANPANVRADGTAGNLNGVELVRRDGATWTTIASGGVGAEKIALEPGLPGSGLQIWGVRSVTGGARSVVSNVTISGGANVVAMLGSLGEDADEANGTAKADQATALTVPASDRPESIWPAGDSDNFTIFARPGDIVTATASPTNGDFRNDLDAVVTVLDNKGDALVTGVAANPGEPATAQVTIPAQGGSTALKAFVIQVGDKSGSSLDPSSAPRVLVPPTYNLSVEVSTPAALQQFGPEAAPVSGLLNPDEFAFANTGANPIRGNANFGYVIPRSMANGASVRLRIYDVRGRMVKLVDSGSKTAGTHFASWSGHDSRGNRMASGPYFARLDAGSYSRTVRIDLLK